MIAPPSTDSHRARGLLGLRWLFGKSVLLAVMRIAVVAIFARILSPEDFGIAAAAGIFIELSLMLSISGVVQPLVQRATLSEVQINTAFTANLISSLLASALVIVISPWMADAFDMPQLAPVLWIVSLSFPLAGISAVSSKLLEREQRFSPLATSDVISYICAILIFGMPLALTGYAFWALIVPQVAQVGIRSLLLLRAQPHALRLQLKWAAYLDLMRDGTGYSLQRFASLFAMKGDFYVVGTVLGAAALGHYERAYTLMNLANTLIMTGMVTVLFPSFARIADDRKRLRTAYLRTLSAAALVFMPMSALAVILAPEIVAILIGSQWGETVLPFQILAAGMFLRVAYRLPTTALNSMGRAHLSGLAQTVYAACVIGGAVTLVPWGIDGVAWAVFAAIGVHFLLLNAMTLWLLSTRPTEWLAAVAPPLLLTSFASVAALAAAVSLRHCGAGPILTVGGASIAAGLSMVGPALLWPAMVGPGGLALLMPRAQRLRSALKARRVPSQWLARIADYR